MSYFARKIDYCAGQCSFVALLEISRAKGEKPFKFILFRYDNGYGKGDERCEMIEFKDDEKEKALKAFPYGPFVFTQWDELSKEEKEVCEDMDPSLWRRRKNLWVKTTEWLYEVAVGGGLEIHKDGEWVKVGRPNLWKNRRKKKKLKFGELGHLFSVEKKYLSSLKETYNSLLAGKTDEETDEVEEKEDFNILNEEIETVEDYILCLKAEMRFKKEKSLWR